MCWPWFPSTTGDDAMFEIVQGLEAHRERLQRYINSQLPILEDFYTKERTEHLSATSKGKYKRIENRLRQLEQNVNTVIELQESIGKCVSSAAAVKVIAIANLVLRQYTCININSFVHCDSDVLIPYNDKEITHSVVKYEKKINVEAQNLNLANFILPSCPATPLLHKSKSILTNNAVIVENGP